MLNIETVKNSFSMYVKPFWNPRVLTSLSPKSIVSWLELFEENENRTQVEF